jgi:hypothetical protein
VFSLQTSSSSRCTAASSETRHVRANVSLANSVLVLPGRNLNSFAHILFQHSIPHLFVTPTFDVIQGDSRGKFSILRGDIIGHCEKRVHMNMYLIMNGYRDRAGCLCKYKSILKRNYLLSIVF